MEGRLMKTKKSKKSGFTLIEVLVALTLFTLLSLTLFNTFRGYTSTINRERITSLEAVRTQKIVREIENYVRYSTQNITITKSGNTYVLRDLDESILNPHRMNIVFTGNTLTINKDVTMAAATAVVMSDRVKSFDIKVENNKVIVSIESTVVGVKKTVKHIHVRGQFK